MNSLTCGTDVVFHCVYIDARRARCTIYIMIALIFLYLPRTVHGGAMLVVGSKKQAAFSKRSESRSKGLLRTYICLSSVDIVLSIIRMTAPNPDLVLVFLPFAVLLTAMYEFHVDPSTPYIAGT